MKKSLLLLAATPVLFQLGCGGSWWQSAFWVAFGIAEITQYVAALDQLSII
ncbi:MAG: hypothetical protein IPM18_05055 [Phycisphaerales bacterium]|nr:hypothetical protein [Phycisphaerales bacterium]